MNERRIMHNIISFINIKTSMLGVMFMLLFSFVYIQKPCLSAQNVQKGKASYYSKRATGSRAASGARIHHDSLTCAHKRYPFGTILRVTNLSNNKSVDVKVIDRGPFGRGRIIDLSYAAAKAIGMLAQGVAMVEVKPVTEKIVPYRMEEEALPDFEFEFANNEYFVDEMQDNATKSPSAKSKQNTASSSVKSDHEPLSPSSKHDASHKSQSKASDHKTSTHKTGRK